MDGFDKMEILISKSTSGIISTQEILAENISRDILSKFIDNGEVSKYGRGLYTINSAWEDDFFSLQQKYSKGIYSHDTALYLLGYSDRTPSIYTMTFPKGYNAPSIKQENVKLIRVIPDNYESGIIEVQSPSNNPIRIYNLERTLCDILRGKGSDIQIVNAAMKKYAASKNKNINQLMKYAEQLKVKDKVLRYMEVLL
ncbi:MAG: type IV toxin-antitoxin system AbiEi family antitoxin domain-containing protein [Erysipelotrichaceae bacterium]|nr:type IV toxin-antitoxin system AbiEi family antitoxin domain-containing protein [Erysipelotrichaceae bacterium]